MAFLIGKNGLKIPIVSDGQRRKLGRSDECEIVIPDPAVSRQHLFLTSTQNDLLLIENAGSQNGYLVNGIPTIEAATIKEGDRVAFGSQEYIFTQNENATNGQSFKYRTQSAQSASFTPLKNETRSIRDISPLKMVFAVFIALLIFGTYLRNMEEAEKENLETTSTNTQEALPTEGYKGSTQTTKSQTEVQGDLKFKESLRDYYNKNYSRAIIGFKESLIMNPSNEEAIDFLQVAEGQMKTQLQDLLKDGTRSYSNLQFRRSKGQALRILTIIGEQIPSYSRKIVQDAISGRQIASTTQEDLMLNLPCEKAKEVDICKKAISLLKDSRKSLKEEEAIR